MLPRRPVSRKSARSSGDSSPSKRMKTTDGRSCLRLDRSRELDDERRAARAVVRADEAGQVLRVVVRADDDRARGIAAGHEADDVAQPAGHGLEPSLAAARPSAAAASFLDAGDPAGRGPSRTWWTSRDQAACLVHAIDGRRGGRGDDYERGQRRYGPRQRRSLDREDPPHAARLVTRARCRRSGTSPSPASS